MGTGVSISKSLFLDCMDNEQVRKKLWVAWHAISDMINSQSVDLDIVDCLFEDLLELVQKDSRSAKKSNSQEVEK